jgi:hypothetical protein
MDVVYIHFEVSEPNTFSLTPKKYGMSRGSGGLSFAVDVFASQDQHEMDEHRLHVF